MRASTLSCIFFATLLSQICPAQDKPIPPPQDFKPETKEIHRTLPNLKLPQYIITGSDVIRFSDNSKQPIELHNAGEFLAHAGRGMRELRFANTAPYRRPLSLASSDGNGHNLFLKAGYGRYNTPYAEAWFGDTYTRGDINAHAQFIQHGEYVRKADSRFIAGDIEGGSFLPSTFPTLIAKARVQGEIHVVNNRYNLFGRPSIDAIPRLDFHRSNTGISYTGKITSRGNQSASYSASLFANHTLLWEKLTVADSINAAEYHNYENNYGVFVQGSKLFSAFPIQVSLLASFADNTDSQPNTLNPFFIRLHSGSSYPVTQKLGLDFGLLFTLAQGSATVSMGRLYPEVKLRYQFDDDVLAFLSYAGSVRQTTMKDMYVRNPYTMLGSEIRHEDIPIVIQIGVTYDDRKNISARVHMEYLNANSLSRFTQLFPPADAQWKLEYDGRSFITTLNGELGWNINSMQYFLGKAVLRSSYNDAINARMPYLPMMEVGITYQHRFPFQLDLSTSLAFVGERSSGSVILPAYLLPGFDAEYHFTQQFGAFLSISNLFNSEFQRWAGYQARPLFFMAGGTARF